MITHETIKILSQLWWQTNIISFGIILFIIFVGLNFTKSKKEALAKVIGIILIVRAIGVHFYWDHLGIWSVHSSLPLHLCGLSAILSGIVIFWRNQFLYELLYYWGIPGAFHSFLTPEFTNNDKG